MNHNRWTTLMTRLGLPPSPDTFDALMAAHSEPTRHYHTIAHITHCLDLVDKLRRQIPDVNLVELAFWFHDAVYDAQSKTNEEDSADLAAQFLKTASAPQEMVQTVYDLIMATKHTAADRPSTEFTPAQLWLVDIDLSILGAQPERFDQYEQEIRREYEWVPLGAFNQGRAALLEGFLAREWIFNTPVFRAMYEGQARENLQRSIAQLR